VQDRLAAAGVGTLIHYPVPVHLSPAYRAAGWRRGDFPIAERLADEVLSLPMNPHVSASAAMRVARETAAATWSCREP
jgi:dTDP-4-amino-4,6-dideoxygalactose transaminase